MDGVPASPGPYTRSPHATESAVGDRVVLYHRRSRTALVLNPTGGWLWQQLAEPRAARDLASDLRARFPSLTAEDAERDVRALLADLVRHAMVSGAD